MDNNFEDEEEIIENQEENLEPAYDNEIIEEFDEEIPGSAKSGPSFFDDAASAYLSFKESKNNNSVDDKPKGEEEKAEDKPKEEEEKKDEDKPKEEKPNEDKDNIPKDENKVADDKQVPKSDDGATLSEDAKNKLDNANQPNNNSQLPGMPQPPTGEPSTNNLDKSKNKPLDDNYNVDKFPRKNQPKNNKPGDTDQAHLASDMPERKPQKTQRDASESKEESKENDVNVKDAEGGSSTTTTPNVAKGSKLAKANKTLQTAQMAKDVVSDPKQAAKNLIKSKIRQKVIAFFIDNPVVLLVIAIAALLIFIIILILILYNGTSVTNDQNAYCDKITDVGKINVVLTDHSGDTIETVPFNDYVLGVLRAEETPDQTKAATLSEFYKTMLVLITTYALDEGKFNEEKTELTIENSTSKQTFCSVEKGCHEKKVGGAISYPSGPDSNGNYRDYFGPITNTATISYYHQLLNQVAAKVLYDQGTTNLKSVQYKGAGTPECSSFEMNDMCTVEAQSESSAGLTYETILNKHYNQFTLGEYGTVTIDENCVIVTDDRTKAFPIAFRPGTTSWRENISRGWDLNAEKIVNGKATGKKAPHKGIDFLPKVSGVSGDNVYAVAGGKIVTASKHSSHGSYGLFVRIAHDIDGDGIADYYSQYAHLSSILVDEKDDVVAGQVIAKMGSTGNSTGPHLHFEIRGNNPSVSDNRVNPSTYLDSIAAGVSPTVSQGGI